MKKILILILILIFPIIALAAAIFSDGWESGDLTAWTWNLNDGGDLSAETAAKLHGTYGMNVFIDDQNTIYCHEDAPTDETRCRARFYIDPNGLTMANNDEFMLFQMRGGATAVACLAKFKFVDPNYKIWFLDAADGAWNRLTSEYTLTDEPHCIEVDWKASTGADDGFLSLWIDGVLKETVADIDNDTEEVDDFRLGAESELDVGTGGTFFLDDFDSNDDGTYIGALLDWNTKTVKKWNGDDVYKWNGN